MNAGVQSVSLASLLAGITLVDPIYDRQIAAIACDSRQVEPGSLFIAYQGQQSDARDFIADAIQRGAIAVVCDGEVEHVEDGAVPIFFITNAQAVIAKIAARFYGHPSRRMCITGVTGTNGKTSITHFIAQCYAALQTPCAIVGTIGNGLPNALHASTHTTPDPISLQKEFSQWRDAGIDHIAMEVSSHALQQNRVKHIEFDTAVFTNLTRDHLDYHGDMQQYGLAKRRLFEMFGLKHAILNFDDPFSKAIRSVLAPTVEVLSYGLNPDADIFADKIELISTGVRFHCHTPWSDALLEVPVYGEFNVLNVLAVIATLAAQKVAIDDIFSVITNIIGVPGRMQVVKQDHGPTAIIDYAHTPDALKNALAAARKHCHGQLWCVFGCGGDRDKGKRALMGECAELGADKIVITDDNPRTESSVAIIHDIQTGLTRTDANIQPDRKQAIEFALAQANSDDLILIAGKGHEDYQIIGDKKFHFSDLEVIQAFLKS